MSDNVTPIRKEASIAAPAAPLLRKRRFRQDGSMDKIMNQASDVLCRLTCAAELIDSESAEYQARAQKVVYDSVEDLEGLRAAIDQWIVDYEYRPRRRSA